MNPSCFFVCLGYISSLFAVLRPRAGGLEPASPPEPALRVLRGSETGSDAAKRAGFGTRLIHFRCCFFCSQDLRGSIEKIAAFLGKPLTDEQLSRLTEYLVFDNFVNNTTATMDTMKELWKEGSRFLRKGKTGDWKNHFDAELNERIDRWIESNLAGSDLHFITELAEQD